jgi:hypothetical protein
MKAILEMDLPKSCMDCRLHYLRTYPVHHFRCLFGYITVDGYDNRRHPDCSLKEEVKQ